MISEDWEAKVCSWAKIHITCILFLIVIILPEFSYFKHKRDVADFNSFGAILQKGPEDQFSQVKFNDFLSILSKSKFSGIWTTSIKESKLLQRENGTIQLKAQQESNNKDGINYKLSIKVFDGQYKDNGYYEIFLNSSSLKTEQQFVSRHLIYETTSPLIGLYKFNKVFINQKQKPIYINKLKFRLNFNQSQLKLQLLFAAQYQINIITGGLETPWTFFQEVLLTFLIVLQVFMQAYGTFFLLLQMNEQQLIAKSISPTFLKLCYYFDIIQLLAILYFCYQQNLKVLPFAAFLLFAFIMYPSTQIYQLATVLNVSSQRGASQPSQQSVNLYHEGTVGQVPQNNYYFTNETVKPLVSSIKKYQHLLMCICSFFIFYMNNMQSYIYIIYFAILLVPQLIRNCRQGNKINYSVQLLLFCAYPRLLPLIFVRVSGLRSLIMFQPDYLFCFISLIFVLISSCVLFIQKKHGSRSILPKFLIPKGMKTKFKFFMIQDQSVNCAICKSQLSQLPPELKKKSKLKQQIIYNKVVATPCLHKFHAECLDNWMQSRIQCPSCNYTLPPIQQN